MNRRELLKGIVAAPVVALLPSTPKPALSGFIPVQSAGVIRVTTGEALFVGDLVGYKQGADHIVRLARTVGDSHEFSHLGSSIPLGIVVGMDSIGTAQVRLS